MKTNKELLQEFTEYMSGIQKLRSADIPSIQLYMDQVTTFMNDHLATFRRYDEDKIMTKTMINNYTKNKLLPAPDKKKYSKDHMILLLFIYYFKSILSITDIQDLLGPVTETYFQASEGMDLAGLYDTILTLEDGAANGVLNDLSLQLEKASSLFEGAENQEELQRFAFICVVSYDVYMKKMLLERMVDEMRQEQKPADKGAKKG